MSNSSRRVVAIGFLFLLGGAEALAAQTAGTPMPVDPAVRTGTLDNGLRYFVRANRRPENRAELRLVVNAGSVLEDDDQRGLAHFVEHMAFNGTENFEKQEIVSYLESIGMRFGADLNAYTGFDETVYMLTVPTDTGSALATGLRILEEWAHRVSFDAGEIEKERGVVIEEWRMGRGAGARLQDQTLPVLLHGSRYAERLPIGQREVLETFPRDALVRYYERWYRPDLMAVIAVGDFDAAEVERMLVERFSGISPAPGEADRPLYPVPEHVEPLVSIATDPEATSSSVQVFFKGPVRASGDERAYRRSLVEGLYDQLLGARLSELAQQPDPPFLGAFATQGELVRSSETYIVAAGVPDGGALRGLDAVLTEIERVARHGFEQSELDRARADLLRGYERAWAERENTNSATYAAEYVRAFLSDEPIPGIEWEYDAARRFLPEITLHEVNALARQWTTPENRVIVAQGPRREGVEMPTADALLNTFEAVVAKEIPPYSDRVASTPLVPRPPEGGTIVEERDWDAVGVTEWRLSNGIRVLLKPTDFKADQVLMRGTGPGGLSTAPDERVTSAELATTAIGQSGVGDRSLIELQKELAGNTAGVMPFIEEYDEGLQGSASPRDLQTLFQLAWLYVTSPRTDSAAFASARSRLRGMLANRDVSPEAAFSDTLVVTMAQHHPRVRPLTVERLEEWDLEASYGFYRERFADVGDFTFVLVGAFDVAEVRPLVERWLGGMPAAGREDTWMDRGVRPPAERIEKIVRRGIEPKSLTQIVFTGDFEYTALERHTLASLADLLEMRLRDVLREDLGGTYGVSVGQRTTDVPEPAFTFQIGFGAEPGRLESLVEAVWDEIAALQRDGPSADALAKVKEAQRREYETGMKENGLWLSHLARVGRDGGDPASVLEVPARIDALTAEMVRDAAQRYLSRERYVRVSLHPATGT